jgi:hypothetical protein
MRAAHLELYGQHPRGGKSLQWIDGNNLPDDVPDSTIPLLVKGCAIELTEATADVESMQSGAT